MKIGMKLILLLALSAVLFTACSKKTDDGGEAADGGGCKYTDAVNTNTIPNGIIGYNVESGDRNSQSARVSWTGPVNKIILLRIKAGADGAEVFREIKGSNSIILTSNDGLNLLGVRNSIDAYVYDSVACITSQPVNEQIVLLDYIRIEPTLTTKVFTVKADKDGDGVTDTGQTDFAVGVALSYTDNSPQGTNNNYTITISTSSTVAGISGNILPNRATPPADSITLPRSGSGANVVLYDARNAELAGTYNGKAVGNAGETTYLFTGEPGQPELSPVYYIYTQVQADRPDGTVDTFYTGITENTPEGSPVRFMFGVTAAQVFVDAVRNFSIASDTKSEFSDFVFTALTPNYDSDLKDAVQLLQQSADAAVSYAVLQLKKAKSGKLYVYSNEEDQMGSTCGFLTADNKFVDFSKIDKAAETAFELCEFTRQLNLQGNIIALSPSSLEDFIRENIKRGLTLSYVLSYDLGGNAVDGGLITTKEVMDAIAAVDSIGYSHAIFGGVAYAPYDTSATAANVLPTSGKITAEYNALKVGGDTVRANAFSTFLVRANVVDAPANDAVDILTDGRDGTGTLPLVGGVILTLDTSAPASYPVIADTGKVLAGAGSSSSAVGGNLVAPFGADANIGTFLTNLAGKNVLIVRDMVKPNGNPYSDLIYGTTAVASGQTGMTPSLEREYNANVRSYMLRDALDNSPLRNAIISLGLDPNYVGAKVPKGADITPHLYGATRATYAISTDDKNLELRYTYPAYGALPANSAVTYAVTSVSRPTGKDENGTDIPSKSTTVSVTGTKIPTGDLGRYQLYTLTNMAPDPNDPASIIATASITADLPISVGAVAGSGAVAPSSDTVSGCDNYILSDTVTLPYDFGDATTAGNFATAITSDKVSGGVCLATPLAFSDDTKSATLTALEIEADVLNLVSTVVKVGASESLPTPNFSILKVLVGPSGLRAVQNVSRGTVPQLQGIDVSWDLSPNTKMVSYLLTVTDSGGQVVYSSTGPALVEGAAEAKFAIPAGSDIVDQGFYTITLASSGTNKEGTSKVTNFPPLTTTVSIDVPQAQAANIIDRLTDGEISADTGKKIVVVATQGFLGRPEVTGNSPIGTVSAIKRARELGIGAVELTVSASSDTDANNVGLFLSPQGLMGEWFSNQADEPIYSILKRQYWQGRSGYSCLNMNTEGRKYEYSGGKFVDVGGGTMLPSATGPNQGVKNLPGNRVHSYTADDLRGCYVRTNQNAPYGFNSQGFTSFSGYGGVDGEKMLELNDEFVKLLKEQNMVLFVSSTENMPEFVRGGAPEFGTGADKVTASFGAVNENDAKYDLTLAKWKKLLLPFLENDYIEGLVLTGVTYEASVTGSATLPLENAKKQIRQYLDLRYVVNEIAADTTNNFAFTPDVTIDTSLPLIWAKSGDDGGSSGGQGGVVKYMQGFFAEWSTDNQGGFVKPTTPRFVLPDYLDNPANTAPADVKKIIAYVQDLDPKGDNYNSPVLIDSSYVNGSSALLAQSTLIGFNAGVGGTGSDNTFATVEKPDGKPVSVFYFPRVFDPSFYIYVPTAAGLKDVKRLAEILVPPVPNVRLRSNPMSMTKSATNAFTATLGFNWHPTDAISGTGSASYGIDFANSGEGFSSAYTGAPLYDFEKGAYVSDPGKWDDSLMFVASGYLRSTASTFITGENIMPLVIALGEFNGLANQEGKLVEPIITNAPLVGTPSRDSGAVSFNIGEGVKLDLDSAPRKSSDFPEFKAAYDELYANGAQYFVGYEITVVGDEQNPIFLPLTPSEYTGSTAFSSVDLPSGSFEFYVRAKYSVPFVDGSGSKDVYSFGVLKNVQ